MSCNIYFEVLWYEGDNPKSKEFKTQKQALDFYEKHKEDIDKSGWWVTKRDKDNNILDDIVY